ncbi:hypothetical protein VKT23_004534 [Stygiomarasmius scandens]|uniref:CCHC-type domain-containing protein n=1 Tax=Marasmiellus scandens TaxID=2682957 RepID=A0ABR1JWY6_9AGAR
MSSVKVLTVGSASGSLRDLFQKIKSIHAKHGPFNFCLCTGDFFGSLDSANEPGSEVNELLEGKIEVPIECYVMQGENPLPDVVIQKFAKTSGELCRNVFLMTKSGLVTTPDGLRIACLGGIYDPQVYSSSESPPGFASPFFSAQSVERLLANTTSTSSSGKDYKSLSSIMQSSSSSQLVDILLTNSWPASISTFSSVPVPSVPSVSSSATFRGPGAPPLDDLARKLKPRYHFAASPKVFWEREPFVWEDEEERVSRFVSLGAFGEVPVEEGGKKQRWFYAFSIAPNAKTPRPQNATKNPFTESRHLKRALDDDSTDGNSYIFGNVKQPGKRGRVDKGEPGKPPPGYKCHRCESSEHFINDCPERIKPPEGYVCRICDTPGHLVRDCPTKHAIGDTGGRKPKPGYVCRACGNEGGHYLDDCPIANAPPSTSYDNNTGHKRRRGEPKKDITLEECWFCLSNPNLAKHLIVSIGNECYVTLPKGQIIPTGQGREGVPGGGHVLIVPITHYPTYSTIPEDLRAGIVGETEKYKTSLRVYYASYNHSAVFFELGRLSGRGKSSHAHVQAVPIPNAGGLSTKVEGAFINEGRQAGLDFLIGEEADEALASLSSDASGSYFRVDLPDSRKMVSLIPEFHHSGGPGGTGGRFSFNLQFGRQVLVGLLGYPERVDWKVCAGGMGEEEEREDVRKFKEGFGGFDPFV